MKLIIAPRAERDLQDIGDWIARDDAADRRHAARFSDCPQIAPRRTAKTQRGRYVIFYRVSGQAVRIARFVHARRGFTMMFRKL